ncbi:MAG: D-2-hydroxyacid dehydrogenase family protein [Rhodospirillales bacterium]|nr:D-2-hydroxyacid dehydrogenase family protein [Rhodospirillales bacterium]
MKKLAIIDDYENVALEFADWSTLDDDVEITVFRDHLTNEYELAERLGDFEIICIMRERTPFPRSLFEKLPKLEHLYTSGMRNWSLDGKAARDNGIVVTGTPTLNYPAAEHAWALILALAKRIVTEDAATRGGAFGIGVNLGLKDKVLGIVGLGKLGVQVAQVGKAFGMDVAAWSQNLTEEACNEAGVRLVSKDEMFAGSDFISVHVHLGTRNHSLIGAAEFAKMKRSAFFINTARGPIVDELALIEALRAKKIAGAGLDVFETEPLAANSPLRQLPNLILTPHQGYVTRENFTNFFEGAVANIRSWLDGKTVNELP